MALHSIKLPHFNNAAEKESIVLPLPQKVIISMAQHVGAPCVPVVAVGDKVKIGDLIGNSDAVISAPVHASVAGTVSEIIDIMHISGKLCKSVVIENDNSNQVSDSVKPPVVTNKEEFLKAVRDSGSIGLGGAGFPSSVKLNFDRKTTPIDTLIVNGAECEPYITSDYRSFIEDGESVADGIKLIMKYMEIPNCVIGIEKDKPKAIAKMTEMLKNDANINVQALKSAYPQGAEKTLIYSTTGRVVKEGELPMSTGCLVMNSSTIAFISKYIKTGMPMVKRRITVDGNIVNKPCNFIVAVGTPLGEIIPKVDLRCQPDKIIFGGPMMGNCVFDINTPVAKTNNAVLMFKNDKIDVTTACIRCGRCVAACSMNLAPTELEHAFDAGDKALLNKLKVNLCVNCGACTFVCPAKRNLAEKNQLAKAFLREK